MQSCTFWLNSVFLLYCNFVIVKIICSPGHVKIIIIRIIIMSLQSERTSAETGAAQHKALMMALKCFILFKFVALNWGEEKFHQIRLIQ